MTINSAGPASQCTDSAAHRRLLGSSFGRAAAWYDRFRPGYPERAVAAAVGGASSVLDLGAGTGKLTRSLVAAGVAAVTAVEPDPQMLAVLHTNLPTVAALQGGAERIPLPDAVVDLVVAGQAMHWFDLDHALPEIARVLRPGGRLVGLWNTSDLRDPFTAAWVSVLDSSVRPSGGGTDLTLAGNSFSGSPEPEPSAPFTGAALFTEPELQLIDWRHRMTGVELHGLADTYSYVLTATPQAREVLHRDLDALVGGQHEVAIAERCQVWTAMLR